MHTLPSFDIASWNCGGFTAAKGTCLLDTLAARALHPAVVVVVETHRFLPLDSLPGFTVAWEAQNLDYWQGTTAASRHS